MRLTRLLRSAALAVGLFGPGLAHADDITVFAAASLKTALDRIATDWKASSGDTVTVSYAGSPQLAKQIEAGHRPTSSSRPRRIGWIRWARPG